ncbi:MAG TPA: beta-ketoacyl-ACP synthase [Hyphomicrobium sp.]|nr:beta-ketoacyl-ACP synthase [Hyphomicrobium sp.]
MNGTLNPQFLDRKGRPLVAVTGTGVVTSLGCGKDENWSKLTSGVSGIRSITRFPTDGLRTTIAGTVDSDLCASATAAGRTKKMAAVAAAEALQEAGSSTTDFPGPLFLATPPAEIEWPQRRRIYEAAQASAEHGYRRLMAAARVGDFADIFQENQFASVGDDLAGRFGTKGLPYSVSTACASGATAIQLGVEAIRRRETSAALCIGTDSSVQLEALVRFSLLSALSTRNETPQTASRPFSRGRDGFVMAEGAGALVLEDLETAVRRGANILGIVRGCGEMADDYHRTRSKPDGSAIIGAIQRSIDDACIAPAGIDCVNAHGTSTPENDKMEYLSLSAVLGEHLQQAPVTGNKSMIGHTLSAAGAIEAVISLLIIQRGLIPPTINYDEPDPEIKMDVVTGTARKARVRNVLSNSFGFGGQNVCLVLGAYEASEA